MLIILGHHKKLQTSIPPFLLRPLSLTEAASSPPQAHRTFFCVVHLFQLMNWSCARTLLLLRRPPRSGLEAASSASPQQTHRTEVANREGASSAFAIQSAQLKFLLIYIYIYVLYQHTQHLPHSVSIWIEILFAILWVGFEIASPTSFLSFPIYHCCDLKFWTCMYGGFSSLFR